MTRFSPKEIFIANKEVVEELKSHREDHWLKLGFAFSISEMAFNGSTDAEISGAKKFISVFQNLWEKGAEPVKLPVRTLSADNPAERK